MNQRALAPRMAPMEMTRTLFTFGVLLTQVVGVISRRLGGRLWRTPSPVYLYHGRGRVHLYRGYPSTSQIAPLSHRPSPLPLTDELAARKDCLDRFCRQRKAPLRIRAEFL